MRLGFLYALAAALTIAFISWGAASAADPRPPLSDATITIVGAITCGHALHADPGAEDMALTIEACLGQGPTGLRDLGQRTLEYFGILPSVPEEPAHAVPEVPRG